MLKLILTCFLLLQYTATPFIRTIMAGMHNSASLSPSDIRSLMSIQSTAAALTTQSSSSLHQSQWLSALSQKEDLVQALDEVAALLASRGAGPSHTLALLTISSLYEQGVHESSSQVEGESSLGVLLQQRLPFVTALVGCTTGCVIGPSATGDSTEVESRAGVAVTLVPIGDHTARVFRYDDDEMKAYASNDHKTMETSSSSSLTLLFATESSKTNLVPFAQAIAQTRTTKQEDDASQLTLTGAATVCGALAASVTALHAPKVLIAGLGLGLVGLQRYTSGTVGVTLTAARDSDGEFNLHASAVVARSTVPVGPVYRIAERNCSEITSLEAMDGTLEVPLVRLEEVLSLLGTAETAQGGGDSQRADALKRELLVALAHNSEMSEYTVQRPTDFAPTRGSLSLPHVDTAVTHLQFAVREDSTARKGLRVAGNELRALLRGCRYSKGRGGDAEIQQTQVLAAMVIGSAERGTRVFRYANWESAQVEQHLRRAGVGLSVPVFGFFAAGTVLASSQVGSSGAASASLAETDAVYLLITCGARPTPAQAPADEEAVERSDVCGTTEAALYTDEYTQVGSVVRKSDAAASHAVRVSTMEFNVPEKTPQPENTLESLCWEREKECDRMRERFPVSRALTLAKAAEKKFPPRDKQLLAALQTAGKQGRPPALLLCLQRSSLNGARLADSLDMVTAIKYCSATMSGADRFIAAAIGVQTAFGGQFEEVSVTRSASALPVICDDLVMYAYQLFRARECGADMVRLHASALAPADLSYLVKTAKTLQLLPLVTVASKPQLLAVLKSVPGLAVMSVTSRNMKLWKLDPGKAGRILADSEVRKALEEHPELVMLREGFADPQELRLSTETQGDAGARVQGVLLGEELLHDSDSSDPASSEAIGEQQLLARVRQWLS